MKLLFVLASILFIQSVLCQDTALSDEKKCEDFLSAETCTNLRNLAKLLHEKTSIVTDAVKDAIAHHKTKAADMLNYIKAYMAERFPCDQVLSDAACNKLVEATKQLNEQAILIKEAIMAAFLKHSTTAKDVLNSVQEYLLEKATNFKCTDVMSQQQCDFLTQLTGKFHLRSTELIRLIKDAVVNGTTNASQIYKVTIGALIEDAKNVKCEDLIPADTCSALDAFANNFDVNVQEVTLAVRIAIANGLSSATDIYNSVKEYLVEKVSCDKLLTTSVCDKIESLANKLHVSYKKITEKLRTMVANGSNSVKYLTTKIIAYVWDLFWGTTAKRSLDVSNFTGKIIKSIMNVVAVGEDVKNKLKAELNQAITQGKFTILKLKDYVKELLAKYWPQSDQMAQDNSNIHQFLIEQLKSVLKKVHGTNKATVENLLAITKGQLEKLKEYLKQVLGNQGQSDEALNISYDIVADMARQEIEDEVMSAEKEILELEQL